MHGLLQSECEQTVWALHRDAGQAANETEQRCRFNPVGQSIKKCSVLQAKCTAITNLPPKSKVAGPRVGIHVFTRRSRRPTGTRAALQRADGALWRCDGPGQIHMLVIRFTSETAMNISKTTRPSCEHANNDRQPDVSGDHPIGNADQRWERSRLAPPLAGLNERWRAGMGRTKKAP